MEIKRALFNLDDSGNPGQARVKLLQKLDSAQARSVKAFTGHDIYRVEVLEVTKPSTFAANPKPGQKRSVSAKHLTFQS